MDLRPLKIEDIENVSYHAITPTHANIIENIKVIRVNKIKSAVESLMETLEDSHGSSWSITEIIIKNTFEVVL